MVFSIEILQYRKTKIDLVVYTHMAMRSNASKKPANIINSKR